MVEIYLTCILETMAFYASVMPSKTCYCSFVWQVDLLFLGILLFSAYTVFVLIEAPASAGISPSETVLILPAKNNYCDRNTTCPLYITSFHCYMTY